MAKLSARGNSAVARVRVKRGDHSMLFALRSDGKVLRRWTGGLSTGYTWFTSLSAAAPRTEETLLIILANRGYDAEHGYEVTPS